MQHISLTPFGRQLRASDIPGVHMIDSPLPDQSRDKWAIVKDLTAARRAFNITDRDLTVLSALVSFHPRANLTEGDGTIVFPSNESLSSRAHGMAESTLRRHLNALTQAGLILRHDSPNGKRYARRAGGKIHVAYGFDLRPLILRDAEIQQAAVSARDADAQRKALREAVVLTLRDVAQMLAFVPTDAANLTEIDDAVKLIARHLRRKLPVLELSDLHARAHAMREMLKPLLPNEKTTEMSGNSHQNERHLQDSNRTLNESDSAEKIENITKLQTVDTKPQVADVTLGMVVNACPDALDYATQPIKNWLDLIHLAAFIAPMLGINAETWQRACHLMTPTNAAITVLAILQRATVIRNPGGYLRSLAAKAESGGFSPAPMIAAILSVERKAA
jgi:replication initiation protein RepC